MRSSDYLVIYLFIGSLYMVRNVYYNTHTNYKYTYNKLSLGWKVMSMIVDMVVWPVVIINAFYRKYFRK